MEMLIPVSDGTSDSDLSESSRPLLEPGVLSAPLVPPAAAGMQRVRAPGRDGPCEHCGMVHTARIPDACLQALSKTETSDDEALLLC